MCASDIYENFSFRDKSKMATNIEKCLQEKMQNLSVHLIVVLGIKIRCDSDVMMM